MYAMQVAKTFPGSSNAAVYDEARTVVLEGISRSHQL